MDILRWFNRQKPITLGFITAITCFIIMILLSSFTVTGLSTEEILKLDLSISTLVFFLSFLMFYQGEKSSIIFKEIDELYYLAKKAKTKTELLKANGDYIDLRNRAEHSGHYAKLNVVKAVLETKKEFYNGSN